MRHETTITRIIHGAASTCCLFALRSIPFFPHGLEPILATQMPFTRVHGRYAGFLFAAANIVLFDLAMGSIGWWTPITALCYGSLSLLIFKMRAGYVSTAIACTLAYDCLTGLTIGPLFFGQSLAAAAFGQLSFSVLHIIGNVIGALTISPLVQFGLTKIRISAYQLTHNMREKHYGND